MKYLLVHALSLQALKDSQTHPSYDTFYRMQILYHAKDPKDYNMVSNHLIFWFICLPCKFNNLAMI